MAHTKKNGLLVVIEGIDGSGKTTLMQNLSQLLQADHLLVKQTKEPGDSLLGKNLRTLLQEKPVPVGAKAEYLLFAADRAQHIEEVIKPFLEKGYIVLCDRMGDSSVVYQGYGRGLSVSMIKTVNAWAMDDIQADITLYVRIDLKSALTRLASRGKLSSFEQEAESFTEKLIQGFEDLYKHRKDVVILDGSQTQSDLATDAYVAIKKYLLKDEHV